MWSRHFTWVIHSVYYVWQSDEELENLVGFIAEQAGSAEYPQSVLGDVGFMSLNTQDELSSEKWRYEVGKFEKLKKQNMQVTADIKKTAGHLQEVSEEYNRVANVYSSPNIILNDIERDFNKATHLNSVDVGFLFFAAALQCIRQYFITQFTLRDERPDDQTAAGKKDKTYTDRIHRWYNPSIEEIMLNPVPFDAICQIDNVKGALKGGGKLGHRLTLGHDPILGWVVGTANIATSTLTRWDGCSFHVKTGSVQRGSKMSSQDFISNPAKNSLILEYTKDKALNQGAEGKKIIVLSLIKEWEHLKSDVNSKNSLPFPIISTFSPKMVNILADYGVDTCNLLTAGKQATYASLINFLIATIHRMIYDDTSCQPLSMYEIKTRKILTYSNVIASASNLIAVAVTEAIAVSTANADLAQKGAKYLDIGGLAVTLYRLITDGNFIKQVKLEFMENQWYDVVAGDEYDFMKES